ncbi:MAG: hypothetical protein IPP14_11560 [Planctomycetes bacterium]|nr:hypothetical protein [Planctomycetota bacterium]
MSPTITTDNPPPTDRRRERAALLLFVLVLVLGPLLALLCGCTVQGEYVKADRATYNAVAPRQARYIEADSSLTDEQRDQGLTTLKTWDLRLRKAEGK